jgi:hypothetical protein
VRVFRVGSVTEDSNDIIGSLSREPVGESCVSLVSNIVDRQNTTLFIIRSTGPLVVGEPGPGKPQQATREEKRTSLQMGIDQDDIAHKPGSTSHLCNTVHKSDSATHRNVTCHCNYSMQARRGHSISKSLWE